jgi:two-component system, sensor histidine kinase YesM
MRMISFLSEKIIKSVNNISIKRKLTLMYVTCILIPILAINSIFYSMIVKKVKEQEITALMQSMDRVLTGILTDVEQCMGVYRIINSDDKLNKILDTNFKSELEYFEIYHEYMAGAVQKFIPNFRQIRGINVYTENHTIIASSNYHFIDKQISESEWYSRFLGSRAPLLYAYIERRSDGIVRDNRYLTIVNKLNNYRTTGLYGNILKIDIDVKYFSHLVESEKLDGNIYLLDREDRVIFSNNNEIFNDIHKFRNFGEEHYQPNHIVINRNFGDNSYLEGWKVVGVFPEKNIAASIRKTRNLVTLVALLSLIVTSLIILVIAHSIKSRLELVSKHLNGISTQKFKIIQTETGEDEIGKLIQEYNSSTTKIKKLIEEVYEAEIEKTKAELKGLQSQINPHFLFNTLNAVRLRCVLKDENETAQIVKHIAKMFRKLIDWEDDLIPIGEEIEFIRDFLEIQKYRYGDKLDYRISVDEELMKYGIPKMCIQPLVENSSIHGIELIENTGRIDISIKTSEGNLCCSIVDNGMGISEERLAFIKGKLAKGKTVNGSIGILNVYKRLKLYFGDAVVFDIISRSNEGTTVTFAIPLEKLKRV